MIETLPWQQRVKPPISLRVNRRHPRLRGCVYWAPFLEKGGQPRDVISRVAGTLNGNAGWTLGTYGKVMTFDGASDYVSYPSRSNLQITADITLCCWAKLATTTGNAKGMIAKTNGSVWEYDFYHEGFGGANTILFWSDSISSIGGPVVSDTNWHHLAFTRIGSAFTFYVDGVIGSSGTNGAAFTSGTGNLNIGSELGGHYNGEIDQPRIYNRGLTHAEILDLMVFPFREMFIPYDDAFAFVGGVGGTTISPDSAIFTFVVPQPSISVSATIVTPDSAVFTFTTPQPSIIPGEVTVSPSPAVLDFSVPNPSVVMGEAIVTPDSVVLTFNVPEPTITVTGTNNPDPVVFNLLVPNPSLTMGAVVVTPDSVILNFSVPGVTTTDGSTSSSNGKLIFLRRRRRQ